MTQPILKTVSLSQYYKPGNDRQEIAYSPFVATPSRSYLASASRLLPLEVKTVPKTQTKKRKAQSEAASRYKNSKKELFQKISALEQRIWDLERTTTQQQQEIRDAEQKILTMLERSRS
jgi:hypothetical protein